MAHIKLQKLKNTRDLGGIKTADGHTVKSNRLIRSGTLFEATPKDIEILTGTHKLKTVVDLRTVAEATQKPDPRMEGVEYIFNPIVDEEVLGITREKMKLTDVPKRYVGMTVEPMEYMRKLYRDIAFGETSKEGYRNFFRILLANGDGAVLWHCSAGKDRVGIGTMLLLSALGADRQTIIDDYLMTAYYYRFENIKLRTLLRLLVRDKQVRAYVDLLMDVRQPFIEAVFEEIDSFGGMDKYLCEVMELTPEKLEKLREMYLD